MNSIFLAGLIASVLGDGLIWRRLPPSYNHKDPDSILPVIAARGPDGPDDVFPFNQVYIFGDSACDTGNYFRIHNQTKPDPQFYWNGRFSNGPMWPDYLETKYNLEVKNFCHGGGIISSENYVLEKGIPDFAGQIKMYKKDKFPDPVRPLAILEFSGNDMLDQKVKASKVARDFQKQVQNLFDDGQVSDFLMALSPGQDYHNRGLNTELIMAAQRLRDANNNTKFRLVLRSILDVCLEMFAVAPPTSTQAKWKGFTFCLNETTKTVCDDPEDYFLYDFYHVSTVPGYNIAGIVSRTVKTAWGTKKLS